MRDLATAGQIRRTYTGRAAIYQALRAIAVAEQHERKRTTVLVPSFHCPTVVDPVVHAGFHVRFYAIDDQLRVNQTDLRNKLDDSVAAAVFIRFFGFPDNVKELFQLVRQGGARVIDDCCHSFLAASPIRLAFDGADFTTYSFWKLVPCVIGGGVITLNGQEGASILTRVRTDMRSSVSNGLALVGQLAEPVRDSLRRAAKRAIGRPERFEEPQPALVRTAAEAYPYDADASNWSMPPAARLVLARANLRSVVEIRRRNFEVLAQHLSDHDRMRPLYSRLEPDVCPWGFPVLLKERRSHDYLIRALGVPLFTFGEVLHPLLFAQHPEEREMLDTARFLSNSLLVLSVHQQLSTSKMSFCIDAIDDYFGAVSGNRSGCRPG